MGVADGGVVRTVAAASPGGEDLLDEILEHLTIQDRGGLGEHLITVARRVDMIRVGDHRGCSFEGDVEVDSRGAAVAVSHIHETPTSSHNHTNCGNRGRLGVCRTKCRATDSAWSSRTSGSAFSPATFGVHALNVVR